MHFLRKSSVKKNAVAETSTPLPRTSTARTIESLLGDETLPNYGAAHESNSPRYQRVSEVDQLNMAMKQYRGGSFI